jgi:hypothetical protein
MKHLFRAEGDALKKVCALLCNSFLPPVKELLVFMKYISYTMIITKYFMHLTKQIYFELNINVLYLFKPKVLQIEQI